MHLNQQFVNDLGGYIYWAMDNNIPKEDILLNLAHDIGGAIKEDKFMLPRTTGYGKYLPNKPEETDNLMLKVLLNKEA